MDNNYYTLGIDIGSTTVKIAILDQNKNMVFSDYERHYANIQETPCFTVKESTITIRKCGTCPYDYRLRWSCFV